MNENKVVPDCHKMAVGIIFVPEGLRVDCQKTAVLPEVATRIGHSDQENFT